MLNVNSAFLPLVSFPSFLSLYYICLAQQFPTLPWTSAHNKPNRGFTIKLFVESTAKRIILEEFTRKRTSCIKPFNISSENLTVRLFSYDC
jgi:hypothetical protein